MSDQLDHFEEEPQLLGHPKGLFYLFFAELWERFSFYGMRALLTLYMVDVIFEALSNRDYAAAAVYASYGSLVYASTVVGGKISDNILGMRHSIFLGGILMALGHFVLAIEHNIAFYVALALIVVGNGFFKPNISTFVGSLYKEGDTRKDSGFTIFYMGINLGSAMATIVCAWLGETYGWNYGFGAAGIGMILGLITFTYGRKYFYGKGEAKDEALLKRKSPLGLSNEWTIYVLAILGIFVVWQMVQRHSVVEALLMIAGAGSLVYIIWYALSKASKVQRDRLFALTILIVFSVIFWALFEQAYTSLNLYADRILDRTTSWFGEIPAGAFLSLNAIFIILFAPVFAWLWIKLDKRNMNPNAAVKFAIGILLVGLGFGALVLGADLSGTGKVAIIWLVLAYLLHTWGELCLSPVGLSYVTKLSPGKIVGFMMGVWFLATAGSEYIASLLANLASIDTSGGTATDLMGAKASYTSLFEKLFYTGLIFGVLLLVISPLVKKMMHNVDTDESGEDEILMEEKH